jgi:hypothetical protein
LALITALNQKIRDRCSVHEKVDCSVSSFVENGKTYLQIDTYGSATRKLVGKTSQSLQINETAAKELALLLRGIFHIN